MATTASRFFTDEFSIEGLRKAGQSARSYAKALIAISILMIVLGIYCINHFAVATLASMWVLGSVLVFGGILHGVNAFQVRKWNIALLEVVAAALYIVTGMIAFREPASAAAVVSLILAVLFMVSGISRSIGAIAMTPVHWGWMLVQGIASFILGLIVFMSWPISLWVVGLFVGIDIVMSGSYTLVTSIMVNRALKGAASESTVRPAIG